MKKTQIKISEENALELVKMKESISESYNDIISMLIKLHKESNKNE